MAAQAAMQSGEIYSVGGANVCGLLTLGAGRDVETDALAFLQGLETLPLNRREMYEEILATTIGGNKAEALRIVEPLHGTCCHVLNVLKKVNGNAPEGEAQDGGVMKGGIPRNGYLTGQQHYLKIAGPHYAPYFPNAQIAFFSMAFVAEPACLFLMAQGTGWAAAEILPDNGNYLKAASLPTWSAKPMQ
jgi:hypothetical protein